MELYEEEWDNCKEMFEPSHLKDHKESKHEKWTCLCCGKIYSESKIYIKPIDIKHLKTEHMEEDDTWENTLPGWHFQSYN